MAGLNFKATQLNWLVMQTEPHPKPNLCAAHGGKFEGCLRPSRQTMAGRKAAIRNRMHDLWSASGRCRLLLLGHSGTGCGQRRSRVCVVKKTLVLCCLAKQQFWSMEMSVNFSVFKFHPHHEDVLLLFLLHCLPQGPSSPPHHHHPQT